MPIFRDLRPLDFTFDYLFRTVVDVQNTLASLSATTSNGEIMSMLLRGKQVIPWIFLNVTRNIVQSRQSRQHRPTSFWFDLSWNTVAPSGTHISKIRTSWKKINRRAARFVANNYKQQSSFTAILSKNWNGHLWNTASKPAFCPDVGLQDWSQPGGSAVFTSRQSRSAYQPGHITATSSGLLPALARHSARTHSS